MKKQLSTLVFLLLVVQMMAGPVSRQQALKSAQQFLNKRGIKAPGLKEMMRAPLIGKAAETTKGVEDAAAYYIFNVGSNDGFVIVSGDDRTDAVLGYTTSGDFNEVTMPDNMRAWLQGYADQISAMAADEKALGYNPKDIAGGTSARQYAPLTADVDIHPAIEPLVKTKWSQGAPYNGMCPEDTLKEKSVTGCVATAMAQIMNYHKYPADFPAIEGYTTRSENIEVGRLDGVRNFDWSALKNEYDNIDSDDAIATLMRYCGQSVNMDYSSKGSGASDFELEKAMTQTFKYKSSTLITRTDYSAQEWDELIYSELSQNYPVLYCGNDAEGGHAFVCDGYDGYGYYHMNWGWGGSPDGYYLLSALEYNGDNIKAGELINGFDMLQRAMINLRVDEAVHFSHSRTPVYQDIVYDKENNALTVFYTNMTCATFDYDLGFGYLTDNDKVVNLVNIKTSHIDYYKDEQVTVDLSSFGTLPDGIYRMVPTSKLVGEEEWYNCYDNKNYYVEIVYSNGVATCAAIHPNYNLTVDIHPLNSTVYANYPNMISATITNSGREKVTKPIILKYSHEDKVNYSTTNEKEFMPGESTELLFSFTPETTGIYTVSLLDYWNGNTLNDTVNVAVVATPQENLNATVSNPRFVGGKTPRLEIDITNNDDFTHPARKGKFTLFAKNKKADKANRHEVTFTIDTIAPGETVTAYGKILRRLHDDWTEVSADSLLLTQGTANGSKEILHTMDKISQKFYIAQLSGFGCANYSRQEALDFSDCDDIIAYTGKVNEAKDAIVMTPHKQMPANTGMVLKGTPQSRYAIKVAEGSVTPIADNDLVATTNDTPVPTNSVLVLGCSNNTIGFYDYTGSAITSDHSYLPKTKTGGVTFMNILWDDPAAISDVTVERKTTISEIFNIAGQKVNDSFKGIIIKNGKKIINNNTLP
ncbi:MAG: C10 family peptidase [Bacteroidaceae bacterium]|nr:C10 family peptidase [Bacteroidaceae bacterium]